MKGAEGVKRWYEKIENEAKRIIEMFEERFFEDPLFYLDYLEDYVKACVRVNEARKVVDYLLKTEDPAADLDRIKRRVRKELLGSPPSHDTSSIMSFSRDIWVYEAKCRFWSDSVFSDIERLTEEVRRWSSAQV